MTSFVKTLDLGGLDIRVNRIITGKVKAGTGPTDFSQMTPGALLSKRNVISHTTGATRTLTTDQSGTLVLLNKADGVVFTLPAASTANIGVWFEFQVNTTITSNAAKWSTATQNTEFFNGSFVSVDEDGTVTNAVFTGDGTTHDNISMNGTTTGGRPGTQFKLTCTAANLWTVTGMVGGNGTVATPFATS